MAGRSSCGTHPATVPYESMRSECPVRLRQERHQIGLDLGGIALAGEVEPSRKALHVGVYRDRRFPEPSPENDVGRLSAHAGKLYQVGHPVGHLAGVTLDQGLPHADQCLGLVLIKAGGADVLLEGGKARCGVIGSSPVLGEQPRCHLIDPFVRALGGKDGGYQKFQGVSVSESAVRVRILASKFSHDPPGTLAPG